MAFNDHERLVGDAAKIQYAANPKGTIFDIKRLIGRTWLDKSVKADTKHFPFAVKNQDGNQVVSVEVARNDRTFSPEEIPAMVLGRMRDTVEAYLGRKVQSAVVTGNCAIQKVHGNHLISTSPSILQRLSTARHERRRHDSRTERRSCGQ